MTDRSMKSGAGGHWWKAWVLLTGLGATIFGWLAFPQAGKPAAAGGISSQVSIRARTLPATPRKPVFQAPVTRTRRS